MRIGSELQVHLKRLESNFEKLRILAPKNKIIFMVKANAYGHGLIPIVKFSSLNLDVDTFGVASLGEGVEIRKELVEVTQDIFVFSDTCLDHESAKEKYLELNLTPVISNIDDLKTVLLDNDYKNLKIVLKFNTGMNRLGIEPNELKEAISLLKASNRDIEHLMTHFSSSYIPLKNNDRTHRQYESFLEIKKELIDNGIKVLNTSVSNSGAIEQKFGLDETHIRPGLMLYGAKSHPKSSWNGQVISDLLTQVIKVKEAKKGTPIGYGAHICHDRGVIVYLALGYGDGILTYYSGRKITLYNSETKILGRVNMDISTLFFKELPKEFKKNDSFYFWKQGVTDISKLSFELNTTAYQVFTAISSRVPRRYLY